MDELSFLIIAKGINDNYYNWESVKNLLPKDPDFTGYKDDVVLKAYNDLVEQHLLVQHPISGPKYKNYFLSDKGKGAYAIEQQKRADKMRAEMLQRQLTESAISTNESVQSTNKSVQQTNLNVQVTNESVQQTNLSIQSINNALSKNIPVQNKLTISNIMVAVFVGIIALASFWVARNNKDNAILIKQLQETNQTLREQERDLHDALQQQKSFDSTLLKKIELLHTK